MSFYTFSPCPSIQRVYATWENGFNDDQIKQIIEIGESLELTNGTVVSLKENESLDKIRKVKVSWIELNNNTGWLYDLLAYIARDLNSQFFDFDLSGFVEHFQYTVYTSDNNHYDWHIDHMTNTKISPRKLSLVLQLSDPSEYEGGDLELMTSSEPIKMKKEKGLVCAFPSWTLHRVTPVVKGIRKTLVIWVAGPKFK